MRVRHPPGRAGRPWLAHRLAVARRGAELLDAKLRALAAEQRRLAPLAAAADAELAAAAQAAEQALLRAAFIGGERQLDLARRSPPSLDVTIRWQTVLGVTCPAEAQLGPFPALPAPGASAALLVAAEAHRSAVAAAVRAAVLRGALTRVEADLRATSLRRNAVQRRWIPAHATALSALELSLEELEREDSTRVRWAAGR